MTTIDIGPRELILSDETRNVIADALDEAGRAAEAKLCRGRWEVAVRDGRVVPVSYRVSNDFHGFERTTRSRDQVRRLVRDSKPRDCGSRTTVTLLEDGEPAGRVWIDGDRFYVERD